MKIAILGSRGVPAVYGGFEICAERLGLGLIQRGEEVWVYCPRNQEYRQPVYQGIRLEFLRHPPTGLGTLIYDLGSLLHASRRDFDVILMLGYGSSLFCILPRLFGKPVVINTDGLEWSRDKWPWYAKLWLRLSESIAVKVANGLVADSRQIQRYYSDRYSIPSSFIPYGADFNDQVPTDELERFDLKPREYYLAVMRMEPENSIEEIVAGFLRSGSRKPLVLVGSSTGFFEGKIQPRLAEAENIRYLGPLDLKSSEGRRKLLQLRKHACAYIHGHTAGGTSPSLLQAMALGVPVIARDNPSTREVLQDAGLYFDSADRLAGVLEGLEQNPWELHSPRVQEAKRLISDHYLWETIVTRYHDLFRTLCNGN